MGKGAGNCNGRPSLVLTGMAPAATVPRSTVPDNHPFVQWARETDQELLHMAFDEASSYPEQVFILHRLNQLNENPIVEGLLNDIELQNAQTIYDRAVEDLNPDSIERAVSLHEQSSIEQAARGLLGHRWDYDIERNIIQNHPDMVAYWQRVSDFEDQITELGEQRRAVDPDDMYLQANFNQQINHLQMTVDYLYNDEHTLKRQLSFRLEDEIIAAKEAHLEQYRDELAEQVASLQQHHRASLIHNAEKRLSAASDVLEQHAAAVAHQQIPVPEPTWTRQQLGQSFTDAVSSADGQIRAIFLEDSMFQDHVAYAEYSHVRVKSSAYEFTLKYESINPELIRYYDEITERPEEEHNEYERDRMVEEMDNMLSRSYTSSTKQPDRHEMQPWVEQYIPTLWDKMNSEQREELLDKLTQPTGWYGGKPTERSTWAATDERQWGLRADVDESVEYELMSRLYAQGATVQEHHLEVPDYQSRHRIEPGSSLVAELPGGVKISYTPHRTLGNQKMTREVTEVTYEDTPALREVIGKLAERQLLGGTKPFAAEDLCVRTWNNGTQEIVPRSHLQVFFDGEVTMGKHDNYSLKPVDWMDSTTMSDYQEIKPGKWLSRNYAQHYQRHVSAFHQALTSQPINVEGTSHDSWSSNQVKALNARKYSDLATEDNIEDVAMFIKDTQHKTIQEKKELSQETPMSERGTFHVQGAEPREAVKILNQLGVARKPARHIPESLIYGGPARNGRILPQRREYVTRSAQLALPADHMVLHGMTGVGTAREAVERFGRLVESGGLKSIAERRRQGIGVASMSPKGDIASGIDTGVPCKIGPQPNYGSHIYFGMNPDVLQRRDVWFAPHDFGAGSHRYEKYNEYAQKIGQQKFHHSPDPKARQIHIERGLGESGNEVYFKHEIPWSDIDTVFVESSIAQQVGEQVSDWKRRGLLPESLRIQPFGDTHGTESEHIAARAKALKQRSQQLSIPSQS